MINIAVMTFMYRGNIDKGELTHEDLVKLCAAGGAKGLEAFDRDFVDKPSLLPLYKKLLADNGMTMPVVDVITNLVYGNAAQKQKGIDDLRRGLDICAELGSEIAHVAGHSPVEGVTLDDARNMIADTLAAHAPMAKARGLTLGIEDFDPSPTLICSAADCLAILKRAKGTVKLVFDTGNFMAAGESAERNLPLMYDHICSFHVKDYGRDPDGSLRGELVRVLGDPVAEGRGCVSAARAGDIHESLVDGDRLDQRGEARQDREYLPRHRLVTRHVRAREDSAGATPVRFARRHG